MCRHTKTLKTAVWFFFIIAFSLYADNPDDYFLLDRGYKKVEFYFAQTMRESQHYQETYQKRIVSIWHRHFILDDVSYYFFFVSEDVPNYTVSAYYNGQEYAKINESGEPPNLWLPMDVDKDGIVAAGEGRKAWY